MPTFTTDWTQHNIALWEKHLLPLKGKSNLHFLEVGSFEGRSACWFLQNVLTDPSAKLTCVDTFAGSREHILHSGKMAKLEDTFDENIRSIGAEGKVEKRKGLSWEVLRGLPLNTYDAIYIDASHIVLDVMRDGVLAWDLLKVGGFFLFDDYALHLFKDERDDPRTAIDAFVLTFRGELDVVDIGWQVILRKKTRSPDYPNVVWAEDPPAA